MAGLLLFGVHLMGLGYLAYRSGYVPRVIGVLLVVADAGLRVRHVQLREAGDRETTMRAVVQE